MSLAGSEVRRGFSLHVSECPRSNSDPALPHTVRCECPRRRSAETMAIDALTDLVGRLWCGDKPRGSTYGEISDWVEGLPENEALALNACLGEAFGYRPLSWEADHPISRVIAELASEYVNDDTTDISLDSYLEKS